MKIMKEFIPLILSGKKKYEFRNDSGKFDGMYAINNKYFKLSYVGCVFPNYLEEFIKSNNNVISTHCCEINDLRNIQVDSESAEWIKNNLSYYLEVGDDGHKYSKMHIYKWCREHIRKLEVIE